MEMLLVDALCVRYIGYLQGMNLLLTLSISVVVTGLDCDCLTGAAQLDQGSYCEPVMYLNAYRKWITLNEKQKIQWARIAGIQMDAMNRFVMLAKDLMDKTERAIRNSSESIDFYGENEDEDLGSDSGYRLDFSALHLDHITTPKELNYYRLIITWISADNIVRQDGLDKTDKEAPFESTVSVAFSRQSIQNLYPNIDTISIKNDRKVKNGVFSIPFNIKYQGNSSMYT